MVRNEILSREEINKEEVIVSSSKIISTVKKTVVTDPAKEIKLNSEIGMKIVSKENVPEKLSSLLLRLFLKMKE